MNNRNPDLAALEMSILDTLESALVLTMTGLAEIYPLPATMLIPTGDYTALHAHSDALATQSQALHEALSLYRQCLRELPIEPIEPPDPPEPPDDDDNDIPF
jgi:hypothetical protein